jgi:hypothetical protein
MGRRCSQLWSQRSQRYLSVWWSPTAVIETRRPIEAQAGQGTGAGCCIAEPSRKAATLAPGRYTVVTTT